MGNLQKGIQNSELLPENVRAESHFEDEMNLVDYFRVLWKRRYLILVGSVLPALIVGLLLLLGPGKYKVTYVYDVGGRSAYDTVERNVYDVGGRSVYDTVERNVHDVRERGVYDISKWRLNQKNYSVLLDRFYSRENTDKVSLKLQENGINTYPEQITFEVSPPFVNLSKVKVTSGAALEQFRQLEAQLLKVTVVARPKNDMPIIASVIRDNLENVIPVYLVEEQLNTAARRWRARMANIEENIFDLEVALKTNKSVLAKLKNMRRETVDKDEGNIKLQFDVGNKSEYLPLACQMRAAEFKIVELEAKVLANEAKYGYYRDLLTLNEKLFAELKDKASSYYTIQQFHSFLNDLVESYTNKGLKEYLNSYIRRIENRISVSAPVTENAKVHAIPKGVARKSAIVFAVSLMISIFAAFLLEGLQKGQGQASQSVCREVNKLTDCSC